MNASADLLRRAKTLGLNTEVEAPQTAPAPAQSPAEPKPKEPGEPIDIRIRQGASALKESALDARLGDRFGVPLREDIKVSISGAGDGKSPGAPGGAGAPPGAPGQPPMPPMPPPTREVIFSTLDRKMPSRDKAVDYYVDVDFSPIVQKDLKPYMDSLKLLGEFLPAENPDSRRLIVTLALTALGVNDIDRELDVLFPPMPPGAQPSKPLIAPPTPPGQPGQPPQLGPGQQPPPQLAPGPMPQQQALMEVREAERAALLEELAGLA